MFDLRGGAALSFVLLVPALAVFLLQRYWVEPALLRDRHRQGRGRGTVRQRVPGGAQRAAGRCCALIALSIAYFYALLLYASLVMALGANHAFTLQHYRVIFTEGVKAIRDTLVIAGFAMPLGGLYGILLGYLVTKKQLHRAGGRWSSCR